MFEFNRICPILIMIALVFSSTARAHSNSDTKITCIVEPCRNGSDDAPRIIEAFEKCGNNGKVVFLNETYHIESVMNTTGLKNCEIDLKGTLLVSSMLSW